MFADQLTRAIAAARTDQLADDIADRIAIAYPGPELDEIVRDMWGKRADGLLTDNEMETLDEAARARREAIQARRTETRSPGSPWGPERTTGPLPQTSAACAATREAVRRRPPGAARP